MAVCIPDVTTRAELKAAVDACVGDRLCEMTMPHWDVSRVTDMSFLFQGKSQFNVDISQWEMSQVTDAAGMFEGAASFYQGHLGLDPAPRTRTRRGCSRAPTPGSPVDLERMAPTRRTGRRALGPSRPCLENERVRRSWCVCMRGWQVQRPGRRPALGVDTECDGFADT